MLVGPVYPIRGGIALHTTLLARHLRSRHSVELISFSGGYPRVLFPGRTDRDPSRSPEHIEAKRILAPLKPWTWVRAARAVLAARADVVVIQWWTPFWMPSFSVIAAAAKRSGAKVVLVCHNVWPHDRVTWLDRALTGLMLRGADAYMVHSGQDAALLRRLRPGAIVEQTQLASHTLYPNAPRDEARRALGIDSQSEVVLFFGFVRRYKGLPYLIEAVALASADLPELHLVVAGEHWGRSDETHKMAARLGISDRVHVADRYIPNEEVGLYLGAADLLAMPYLEATQSGIATLALGAGVPVVASAVGGLPDAIIDGVTGLLVPPADARSLADAIVRFFREPGLRLSLGEGLAAQGDRFAWTATLDTLNTIAMRLGVRIEPDPDSTSLQSGSTVSPTPSFTEDS